MIDNQLFAQTLVWFFQMRNKKDQKWCNEFLDFHILLTKPYGSF